MKIGMISNSHDNIGDFVRALSRLKELDISALTHCGDFCAPYTIRDYMQKVGISVYSVFGYIDDNQTTTKFCDEADNNILYGGVGE